MTSTISRKRVAVSTIASAGSKKRKVEIKAIRSAPIHRPKLPDLHRTSLSRSTIAITATTAGDVTEDASDIIENLERDTMGASWRTALEAEFTKPYFRKVTFRGFACTSRRVLIRSPQLKDFLILETKSYQVYPPGECIRHDGAGPRTNPCIRPARDIYSWSQLTPLDAVKAVVIGQARPSSLAFRRSNSLLPYVRTHTMTLAKHTVSHPG